jgi:uncharacterized coiled-coil DUF342 family protein
VVKIIIHCAFILLLLVSIGVNVLCFTKRRDSQISIDTENTIKQLSEENRELRKSKEELIATVERFEKERSEINQRLEESISEFGQSISGAKSSILDAIESNKRIGEAASRLRD